MSEEAGFNLLVPFLDGSESFTLGFECGMIWNQLINRTQFSFTCHRKNIDQFKLFAKHFGYIANVSDAYEDGDDPNYRLINDEWCTIDFEPRTTKSHYLKVVK